eukprot:6210733-Pleurochrysis_carterae.AAC.2
MPNHALRYILLSQLRVCAVPVMACAKLKSKNVIYAFAFLLFFMCDQGLVAHRFLTSIFPEITTGGAEAGAGSAEEHACASARSVLSDVLCRFSKLAASSPLAPPPIGGDVLRVRTFRNSMHLQKDLSLGA